MQSQKGNEGCQGHYYEEWQVGNSGCMSRMWDKDVQNREELRLLLGHQIKGAGKYSALSAEMIPQGEMVTSLCQFGKNTPCAECVK